MNITFPMLAISHHGGVRVLISLINNLSDNGHNVRIVSTTKNESPYNINKNVKIDVVFSSFKSNKIKYILFFLFSFFYLKSDLIVANHFLTVFPTKLASIIYRKKGIFFVQGFEAECIHTKYSILNKFLLWLNNISFGLLPVISANKYLSARLSQYTRIELEYNLGVSKKWLLSKSDMKCDSKVFDVAYFARFEKNKGLDRFLDIVNVNKNISYLCISQDKTILEKLHSIENITTVRPKTDEELYSYIDMSKILLLTSYKEGFALPPLEAMFRGVPLIYFECGGPSVYANEYNSIKIKTYSEFRMAVKNIKDDYFQYRMAALDTANDFILENSFLMVNLYLDKDYK
ncbi:glycosyltransferase family 4 protein [Photobacterium damselae]|uniref:glycosyltransferase family 4 protein n=1 Tax=Photobacterium damselae TaxID=38293 RepID=UPI00406759D9